eukprot:c23186_g1_i1 orf=226-1032(-)
MDSISSGPAPHSNTEEPLKKLRDSYSLMHKALLKSMNAYAIVLSILLASSFAGFSQAPKPFIDKPNVNHSSTCLRIFSYFNGFSFFFSVTGLLFYASTSCSPLLAFDASTDDHALEKQVEKKLKLLANIVPKFFYIVFFFGVSLTCCVLAYVFAGFSAVPNKIADQLPVIITAAIGGFVYVQALCVCLADAYHLVSVNLRPNQKLWGAMKKENIFGMMFGCYMDLLCSNLKKASDADSQQGFDQNTLPTSSSLDTMPQLRDPQLQPYN